MEANRHLYASQSKHDVLIRGNGRTIADGVQLDNIRLLLEEYEQAAKNTRLIDEQGFHESTDSANRLTVWSAYEQLL